MTTTIEKPVKHIYRIGDRVRIITPEVFVRCGYPQTRQMIMDAMTDDDHKRINDLATHFDLKVGYLAQYGNPAEFSAATADIADRLAYHVLKKNHFGGTDRRIYTETKAELKGRDYVIKGKRCYRTGEYSPRSAYNDFETGNDNAYLSRVKTHIVLTLGPDYSRFQIEACHAEPFVSEYRNVDGGEVVW